jgi:hypothetical protein
MHTRLRNVKVLLQGLIVIAICGFFANPCRSLAAETATPEQAVKAILATAGVQGGLVVHLGCGDGRLTAALRINDKYTVHGLDADAARIEAARAYLSERGLYGVVSVERLGGATLPYADNLINLVIAEDPGLVSRDEIMRVLAPEGVAYVRQGGGWEKSVKLRPKEIDEWTHYLHDAGNNAVARDEQVAPPRSLKWLAPPLWLRSHETPSGIQALVASGGRLFYFFDEGLVGITDQRLPERWSLVCRDAFNGKQLWKKPLQAWGWPQWAKDRFSGISWTEITGGRTAIPEENQRRLVALGDRLYATLSYRAPLSILDAATGEVLRTVPETEPVQEILASEGIVLVHARDPLPQAGKRREARDARPSTLIAVDGKSGKVLWKKVVDAITPLFLAIDGGRVYFRSGARMCCLSLADGQPAWEQRGVKGPGRTLIAHGGVLVAYVGTTVQAWDGSSGQALWQRDVPPSSGAESPDLFVTGGIVWRGMIPVNEDLKAVNKSEDALALGFDLRTGEQKKKILARKLRSPEHHHRCYRNKATERYIISGMEGVEFMDLQGKDHCQNNWLRGACKLGIMPCNGLLYVPSDQCFCQPGAKLLGFAAVAGNLPARKKTVPDDQRRRSSRGPRSTTGPRSATMPLATVPRRPLFRHRSRPSGAPRSGAASRSRSWPATGSTSLPARPTRSTRWTWPRARRCGSLSPADGSTPRRPCFAARCCLAVPTDACTRFGRAMACWPGASSRLQAIAASLSSTRSSPSGRCTAACWSTRAWPMPAQADRRISTEAFTFTPWIPSAGDCSTRRPSRDRRPGWCPVAMRPSGCLAPIPTCWCARGIISICGRRSSRST